MEIFLEFPEEIEHNDIVVWMTARSLEIRITESRFNNSVIGGEASSAQEGTESSEQRSVEKSGRKSDGSSGGGNLEDPTWEGKGGSMFATKKPPKPPKKKNYCYVARELFGHIDPEHSSWKLRPSKKKVKIILVKDSTARGMDKWHKIRRL